LKPVDTTFADFLFNKKEKRMKKFSAYLFGLIVFSLVFPFSSGLYAHDHEVKCPVCGSVIKGEAKYQMEYNGKTYYFAGEKCMEAFKKAPEKYAASSSEKEGVFYYCPMKECKYKSDKPGKCPKCGMDLKKHEPKAIYVCPMKQCNVKSDKPGNCPKCGMKLKKVTPAAHDHEKEHTHDHEHSHTHN
jgi:YHS domain-containing protein